jgi:ankyrin repeat protein
LGAAEKLVEAAGENDAEMVELLLGDGADPAMITADGRTALDLALQASGESGEDASEVLGILRGSLA